ncbi:hypothetical protein B0H19DRAFT_1073347 [Mycena capillaripes]|nr:hypothetical protein B0H19DRAFT_1073347 [Mycena capillaripes]
MLLLGMELNRTLPDSMCVLSAHAIPSISISVDRAGPEAGARGTARRSRKKSNNNRRNRPDVASDTIERPVPPQYHATAPDLIRDLTPMFGQIPVNPAPINFSRYRKNSTEAVNMDPKYKGPALAAARRSTASLVENHGSRSVQGTESSASFINQPQASSSRAIFSFPRNRTRSIGHSDVQNHRPSTPHVARSPLPFVRNPPEPAKGSAPFWRNRKRSTGRGDAMKNNPPSQPSSPFMGNPQASRGVFPYPRNRKPSTDTGDAKKNNPPLQSSSSFLGDRQASRSIFPYLNHRKVSSGAGDAIKNSPPSQSSSSRAGNTPQASKGVFQLPRNRKRSVDAGSAIKNNPQFATATQSSSPSIANPDASRVISPNTGNRKQSTGPRGAIANNLPYSTAQSWSFVRNSPGASRGTFPVPTGAADAVKIDPPFPANQAAMESCFSLAEAGAVKRVKKLSFKFPFTRNRNRSATTGESPDQQLGSKQTAKESSASLAESASQGPSTIVNFFRDRTRKQSTGNDDSNRPASGSSPAPLLGKDIPISNPSRSVGNPRLIQEQQHAQKRAKLEADTNSPPGRAGKSPASPTKPVGRLQLPRLEPRHVAAVVPSQPSPSVSSRPLIPRAQIAKRVASNDVPLCISTTMPPDDTAEPSSSTCVERTFTQELSAGSATHDKIYTHSSFTDLPELMAPHMESKSVVAPPKKRKSAPKGLFLKPFVSTIAFPTSRDEEIQVDTTAVDEEFNLTADSKYSIYKVTFIHFIFINLSPFTQQNLLDVLWTEAKSQNNLQIQQEIIQCSKSRNISASSPDFAILVSALDSQRHLLQIASALSLDEDVKIRALGNDRKKIKAYLIASQTTILDAAQEAHCLLDLVQHVLISALVHSIQY